VPADLLGRDIVPDDFAKDIAFADAARDELRILGAEIQYENALLTGRNASHTMIRPNADDRTVCKPADSRLPGIADPTFVPRKADYRTDPNGKEAG
jgi:hypothetical protein